MLNCFESYLPSTDVSILVTTRKSTFTFTSDLKIFSHWLNVRSNTTIVDCQSLPFVLVKTNTFRVGSSSTIHKQLSFQMIARLTILFVVIFSFVIARSTFSSKFSPQDDEDLSKFPFSTICRTKKNRTKISIREKVNYIVQIPLSRWKTIVDRLIESEQLSTN